MLIAQADAGLDALFEVQAAILDGIKNWHHWKNSNVKSCRKYLRVGIRGERSTEDAEVAGSSPAYPPIVVISLIANISNYFG